MYINSYKYFLLIIFLSEGFFASGQGYNFFNLTVNEGLVQSQATSIVQDAKGYLWIATQGGISRFDGKKFIHYTESDGLISNTVFSIACDIQNRIWLGTDRGVAVFDSGKFIHLPLSKSVQENVTGQLVSDSSGRTFALARGKLYEVTDLQIKRVLLKGDTNIKVTSIAISPGNELWCGTVDSGLFILNKDNWRILPYPATRNDKWFIRTILFTKWNGVIFTTNHGLFTCSDSLMAPLMLPPIPGNSTIRVTSLQYDQAGNTWLGTESGAAMISEAKKVTLFNAANGYSDNRTNYIYRDRENNIWLATDGQGIFRYSGHMFTFYSEKNGLPNPIVMSLTKDQQRVWIGTYGGGIVSVENGNIKNHVMASADAGTRQVMCTALDKDGNLWVGTYSGGLWMYNGRKYVPCTNNISLKNKVAIGELFTDTRQRVWVATSNGFGYCEKNKLKWLRTTGTIWGFSQSGESILAATDEGLLLVDKHNAIFSATKNEVLQQLQVTGILKDEQGNYWLQTNGRGVLVWNREKDSVVRHFTSHDGLSSDVIYSAIQDKKGSYWIGTGYGLNRLEVDDSYSLKRITRYGKSQGMFGMEANKNSLLEGNDGNIYYGTTKGLFIYDAGETEDTPVIKEVLLQGIKLFGKPLYDSAQGPGKKSQYPFPAFPELNHRDNNLTFDFLAINFGSAEDIQYQYYLEGAESAWSNFTVLNSVNYSALNPGNYTFKIRAKTSNSDWSGISAYAFIIQTPIYQTWVFRIMVILGFVFTGILIQVKRTNMKMNRTARLDVMRREEQNKVRQKTAEDFHDEMGNKLTRISLLADILTVKLNGRNPEIVKLAEQIKDNTVQLYNGTRDIIWSLDPASDNLYEILDRISDFATDLFRETGINFTFEGLSDNMSSVKLPMDYNRNITMIFKEGLNNSLKHAGCTKVLISVTSGGDKVKIELTDNGVGFNINESKKGHGIDNMKIRAKRIDGALIIHSETGKGTIIQLVFKILS